MILRPDLSAPLTNLSNSLVYSSERHIFAIQCKHPQTYEIYFTTVSVRYARNFVYRQQLRLVGNRHGRRRHRRRIPAAAGYGHRQHERTGQGRHRHQSPLRRSRHLAAFAAARRRKIRGSSEDSAHPVLYRRAARRTDRTNEEVRRQNQRRGGPALRQVSRHVPAPASAEHGPERFQAGIHHDVPRYHGIAGEAGRRGPRFGRRLPDGSEKSKT